MGFWFLVSIPALYELAVSSVMGLPFIPGCSNLYSGHLPIHLEWVSSLIRIRYRNISIYYIIPLSSQPTHYRTVIIHGSYKLCIYWEHDFLFDKYKLDNLTRFFTSEYLLWYHLSLLLFQVIILPSGQTQDILILFHISVEEGMNFFHFPPEVHWPRSYKLDWQITDE